MSAPFFLLEFFENQVYSDNYYFSKWKDEYLERRKNLAAGNNQVV